MIRLDEALQIAYSNDPRFLSFEEGRIALDGQIEQAGVRPNPVLSAEAENFLGTGPLSGIQGIELTLGLSQVIETGNKRGLRVRLEERNRDLFELELARFQAELELKVSQAYLDVLIAGDRVELRRDQHRASGRKPQGIRVAVR